MSCLATAPGQVISAQAVVPGEFLLWRGSQESILGLALFLPGTELLSTLVFQVEGISPYPLPIVGPSAVNSGAHLHQGPGKSSEGVQMEGIIIEIEFQQRWHKAQFYYDEMCH